MLQSPALAAAVPALTRVRFGALLADYAVQHLNTTWWISDGANTRANVSEVEGVLEEPRYQANRREGIQEYPRGPNVGEAVWVAYRVRTAACGKEERDPMVVTVCEQVSGKGALSPILYALEPRTLHTPLISVCD